MTYYNIQFIVVLEAATTKDALVKAGDILTNLAHGGVSPFKTEYIKLEIDDGPPDPIIWGEDDPELSITPASTLFPNP